MSYSSQRKLTQTKIKRFEEENKELKEQLKVNYANIYKQL